MRGLWERGCIAFREDSGDGDANSGDAMILPGEAERQCPCNLMNEDGRGGGQNDGNAGGF